MPKVSVLMPVYNTPESYLREAIRSILAQSFSDFDLDIRDNGSASVSALRELAESFADPRIRFFENGTNLGISASRNKLLEAARGGYVAVADSDDVFMPGRLQKQADFLDAHPDVGVVGSWTKYFPGKVKRYPVTNREIENGLMYGCVLEHPAVMIRKSVLEEHHIDYEPRYTPAEDYALFCRLLNKTRFANLPEVLLRYRAHIHNTSHALSDQMAAAERDVQRLVRREHPDLWRRAQQEVRKQEIYKLFGAIPIVITETRGERTSNLLFGILPLLVTTRQGRKTKRRLFGIIPLLHSKYKEKLW
jgi:glycosyltransferase involved in cell wall biosynthesis